MALPAGYFHRRLQADAALKCSPSAQLGNAQSSRAAAMLNCQLQEGQRMELVVSQMLTVPGQPAAVC